MIFWKKFLIHLAANSISLVIPTILLIMLKPDGVYYSLFALPYLIQGTLSFFWVWNEQEVVQERIKRQAKPLILKIDALRDKAQRFYQEFEKSLPSDYCKTGRGTPEDPGLNMSLESAKLLDGYKQAKKSHLDLEIQLEALAMRWYEINGTTDDYVSQRLSRISQKIAERVHKQQLLAHKF